MVVAESRDVGMDRALERARTLHTSVGVALHDFRLDPQEMTALREIRTHISMLENKVREIKVAKDDSRKASLLAELDPIRQQVIGHCYKNKDTILACQGLVQEIVDWCELKASTATAKPATYRSSVDDVQRSTDALISYSGFGSATDVSSSWVQSQAEVPQSKASAYDTSADSLNLGGWDSNRAKLRPLRTAMSSGGGAVSSGGAKGSHSLLAHTLLSQKHQQQHEQQQNGLADQFKTDIVPASPAAVAAGTGTPKIHQATEAARAHAARVTAQRHSMEQAAAEQQQEQLQSWKGQLNQAQQLARQLRPARPFLHLDGRSDASLTSSGGSGQLPAYYPGGDLAASRYSSNRGTEDDGCEGEAGLGSGWDAVQHLRQQHLNGRSSMRTSIDISRALKSSNVVEAAILSSNASRVHILHDAVSHKPHATGKLVDVPVVPACLAVGKKRRWWVKLLQALVATAGVGGAAAAAGLAATGKLDGIMEQIGNFSNTSSTQLSSDNSSRQGDKGPSKEQQQRPGRKPRLPYAPIGPAPDASAGCG